MKKNVLLLPLLVTTLFQAGCVPETSSKTIQMNAPQATPPPLPTAQPIVQTPPVVINLPPQSTFTYRKFKTVQGSNLTIGQSHTGFLFPKFQGKIILFEVFGQECPHCFKELPSINNLQLKYRQNLQVVALQVQEPMSRETSNRLIRQFNMDYPIIDRKSGTDLMYELKNNYEWNGILPFILLIKDGVTQEVFRGEKSQERIERAIKELL